MEAKVYTIRFGGRKQAVGELLSVAGLAGKLEAFFCNASSRQVLIKPNIVNASPPPVTTPAWVVGEIADFIMRLGMEIDIVVADGTGEPDMETLDLFELHGYPEAVGGVVFMDLNHASCRWVALPAGRRWDGLYLPEAVLDSFLISVPVLKAHTLAGVTLSMKNMIGACPPEHYQEGGYWRKSAFHKRIQASIIDLNSARLPDFVLLDATTGMAESHLGGALCDPPVDMFLAGDDPVAVDAVSAGLLKIDWHSIAHIKEAAGILGCAECVEVVEIS